MAPLPTPDVLPSQSLPDVVARLQPSLHALEAAEQALDAARKAHRRIVSEANALREREVVAAAAILDGARAVHDRATHEAGVAHNATITAATKAVDDARTEYTRAAAEAAPLLNLLNEARTRVEAAAAQFRDRET